ncbi:hypothetical protein Sp245p_26060 (plasmid) [Azospirillum baldaniorum]|uniref:Uncharacterized protein n=1 Tax=Azospirillum baldaniorum TaxID=1064539 RepID=A0A9P1NRI9_9PROT|nr:hypothetical protein [Azospirillum baldaniorum]AWJ93291.1 hypothetical protein Sp245p_26060 [Azospirillum baldaniorum]TWA77986.1 hypothetical protein FBZ85_106146 [Azospirillum brasilense]CCD02913.1 protein of unknown function [Azospirillum baldaniorum]
MTPAMLSLLRATPGQRDVQGARLPSIAERAGLDLPEAKAVMQALTGGGFVNQQRVPRDFLYFRTPEGDAAAAGGV